VTGAIAATTIGELNQKKQTQMTALLVFDDVKRRQQQHLAQANVTEERPCLSVRGLRVTEH
jgi:hypothetical protein